RVPRLGEWHATGLEQRLDLLRRQRPAEQEALRERRPHPAELIRLAGPLDPFGDHIEQQAVAEIDDSVDELRLAGVVLDAVDERAVDLEDVEREVAQMRQR